MMLMRHATPSAPQPPRETDPNCTNSHVSDHKKRARSKNRLRPDGYRPDRREHARPAPLAPANAHSSAAHLPHRGDARVQLALAHQRLDRVRQQAREREVPIEQRVDRRRREVDRPVGSDEREAEPLGLGPRVACRWQSHPATQVEGGRRAGCSRAASWGLRTQRGQAAAQAAAVREASWV
eukprot:5204068-Prymnesium_polylepis.1